jgi:hypothetical protein
MINVSWTSSIRVSTALVALLLWACVSQGPSIRAQSDPSADFSRYRTYAFFDEVSGSNIAYDAFIAKYLKEAIAREMQARGYRHDQNPDLLVNFNVLAQDKVSVSQTPTGYYGYRRGLYGGWGGAAYQTDVRTYTQGTLNIDVVESATRQLIWEGVAVGQIRDKALENPQPAINAVVTQVFSKFPGTPPSSG